MVVHRLTGTDNPVRSSNCPSKSTDRVRRIVHSKLKLFHFQIKKDYLSDANHQTNNSSHTNNPSSENGHICYNECRAPALSWAFACLLLIFHKDRSPSFDGILTKIIFKMTIDISMCN